VRNILRFATVVACTLVLGLFATSAQAQPSRGAAATSQTSKVAVVDIGYVLKNHVRFQNDMEGMKKDFLKTQKMFGQRRDDIEKAKGVLRSFNVGSPDYRKQEVRITRMMSDLQADMALAKKDFRERESKIFYNTYMEISSEVKLAAERFGFDLVVRYSSKKIDPRNPNSVMQGINRPVIYQNNIDITSYVLGRLNPKLSGDTIRPRRSTVPR